MRRVLPILVLVALTACASAGGTAGSPELRPSRLGIYEFSASIQGSLVSGKLHVLPDTILVDSENSDCGRATDDVRFFVVGCRSSDVVTMDRNRGVGGAILRFDRGNPAQCSKWGGNVPVIRRREVCAQYEVRNGRQVCTAMKIETYEDTEPKSGPVNVRRVP